MPRAPKACNQPGCPKLVGAQARDPNKRRCDDHYQPWDGHKRHKGIAHREFRQDTAAHRAFRKTVLDKAHHLCQLRYAGRCIGLATQVDRIDNAGEYTEDNCQAACEPCHQRKTSIEGHRAQGHRV